MRRVWFCGHAMQMYARLALGIAAAAASVFLLAPTPQAKASGAYYMMHCRGTFSVNTNTSSGALTIRGEKSSKAAGVEGASLDAGTCAWNDRALNASEHPVITFANVPDKARTSLAPMLATCGLNPNCTLSVRVRNNGSGYMVPRPGKGVKIRGR